MYTLDYSLDQLTRLQDRIDSAQPIRIIHLLYDDSDDHYIVLVDCDAVTYTWLLLL